MTCGRVKGETLASDRRPETLQSFRFLNGFRPRVKVWLEPFHDIAQLSQLEYKVADTARHELSTAPLLFEPHAIS